MTDFLGFFFKDANEFFADNLAFLFRIADALEFRQETFLGVNTDEVHVKVSFEDLFHLVAFVLTKQAMVNKDAGESLTHGLVDENRKEPRNQRRRSWRTGHSYPPLFHEWLRCGSGQSSTWTSHRKGRKYQRGSC